MLTDEEVDEVVRCTTVQECIDVVNRRSDEGWQIIYGDMNVDMLTGVFEHKGRKIKTYTPTYIMFSLAR